MPLDDPSQHDWCCGSDCVPFMRPSRYGCDTTQPKSAVCPPKPSASMSARALTSAPCVDQPARDLHLVVVDAQVQQRRARQRCAVQRQRLVVVAAELRRIDLPVGERAASADRGSRRRCASSRSIRPRCTAIGGVSGSSMPCAANSSRHGACPPGCGSRSRAPSPTGASRSPCSSLSGRPARAETPVPAR